MIHPERLRGRYAFAAGDPIPEGASTTFVAAWREAEAHRDGTGPGTGRDCGGHHPLPPQLCARDVRNVCNCCGTCRRDCVLPVYPPPRKLRERLSAAASTALARLLNRLPKP